MAKKGKKGLAQRVSRIEQEVKAIRATEVKEHATVPARPEDLVALREVPGNRNQDVGVSDRLAALRGASRSDLVSDAIRGASSPLTQPRRRR